MSSINPKKCAQCGLCIEVCPNRIIYRSKSGEIKIKKDKEKLCMHCGHCMAICPSKAISINGLSYQNNFYDLQKISTISSTESFFNLISTRRAIRNFKNKKVSREILEKIIKAISLAPPSFPPLKIELSVVQDTKVIKQALPYMLRIYTSLIKATKNPILRFFIKKKIGRNKYGILQNHIIPLMSTELPDLKNATIDIITRNAPAMIIFHAQRGAENIETDAHIALSFGFLAAHSLGLGACPVDLIPPTIERVDKLKKIFKIPANNKVVSAMILGYPKYNYIRAIKRKLKHVEWI